MKPTILTAKDDADISLLVQHHLEGAGFEVRVFGAAQGVIQDATKQPPALFLLDIMMPGGNGLDLCRRIRETPSLISVPVIFLTAREHLPRRITTRNDAAIAKDNPGVNLPGTNTSWCSAPMARARPFYGRTTSPK